MHTVQGQLGQENQQNHNQSDSQNTVQTYTNFLSPSSDLAMSFNFDMEGTEIFQLDFNSTTSITSSSSSTAVIASDSSISSRTADEISSFRDFSFSHLMDAGEPIEETRVRALSSHNITTELPTPENSITGTGSAAFYADNPEDGGTMSPLMMSGAVSSNYQYMEDSMDTDDIFTPLVSPAITPSYPQIHPHTAIVDSTNLSPLSSPALTPHQTPYLFSSTSILPSNTLKFDSQVIPSTEHIHQNLSSPSLNATTTPAPITKSPRVSKSPTNRLKSTSKTVTSAAPYEVIQKSPPTPKRKRSNGSITPRQAKGASSLSTSSPQLQPSRSSPKFNLTQSPNIGTTTSMPPPLQPIGASSPLSTIQSPVSAIYSPASRPQYWAQSLLPPQQIQQQSITPSTSTSLTSISSSSSAMAPATPASLMKLTSTTASAPSILTPVPSPALYASPTLYPSPSQRTSPALLPSPSLHPLQPLLTPPAMTPVPMPPPMIPGVTVPASPTAITRSPGGKGGGAIRTKDSSRTKLRTISPVLRPNINPAISSSAITHLTQNSNYTTIASGAHNAIGITYSPAIQTGIEVRRTSHKAAEQRRRDTLKQSFERLRDALADYNPASNNNNNSNDHVQDEQSQSGSSDNEDSISTSPRQKRSGTDQNNNQSIEGSNTKAPLKDMQKDEKQMSKVLLLTRCLECIEGLKQKGTEKDKRIKELESEVDRLKYLNGEGGSQMNDDTITEIKKVDNNALTPKEEKEVKEEKEEKEKKEEEKEKEEREKICREKTEEENEKETDIVIVEKS